MEIMIINDSFSVHKAESILKNKNQYLDIFENLNDSNIEILDHKHTDLKHILLDRFSNKGWALRPKVYSDKVEYIDLFVFKDRSSYTIWPSCSGICGYFKIFPYVS